MPRWPTPRWSVTSRSARSSADVTTAYKGGAYSAGKYAGGERDERGKESALGDLVANALRDGIPATQGKADLGVVNPGGLRAELLYAGDAAANPANTDGVVSYAEANNVLPFVNNVWLVQLTGAQLKAVLEQQWQPTGADRPYLHLGLSDNVRVTQKPGNPVGKRITSVLIDGVTDQAEQDLHGQHVQLPGPGRRQLHRLQGREGQGHRPGGPRRVDQLPQGCRHHRSGLRPAADRGEQPADERQGQQAVPLPGRQPRPDVAGQPAEHRGGRLRHHARQEQAGRR